jgi:hypothetical protein
VGTGRNSSVLFVVDGAPLGVRADGTTDHELARRSLALIDPTRIVSIEILKAELAVPRFGPAAHDGVALIVTRR